MSLASYSDLQTTALSLAHKTGDTTLTAQLPDLIVLAEARIYRDVRAHEMETAFSSAISSGVVAAPSGFLGWKSVYVNSSPVQFLQTKTLDWIYQNYPTRSADGAPKFIARNGTNFEFGPYPDSTYTIKGTYWAKLAAVSSSWNALATAFPELFLFATMCEVAEYVRDLEMLARFEAKYSQIVESINAQNNEIEFSGAPLAVTAR